MMAREKYSLLESIRPQLSEKKYRELCDEIVFRKKLRIIEGIKQQGVENEWD